MSDPLNTLLQDTRIWQGRQHSAGRQPAETTGYPDLDRQLGGLGWPRGALSECLLEAPGIGELQLMLPLMQRVTAAGQVVFWLNPPHVPYAPALAREHIGLEQVVVIHTKDTNDLLWSLENCLRSPVTGLVMAWPSRLASRDVRRLQLAAEAGQTVCVLFRPLILAEQSSPAALRLALSPGEQHSLQVEVLKRRGSWPGQRCPLAMGHRADLTDDKEQQGRPSPRTVVPGPWAGPSV